MATTSPSPARLDVTTDSTPTETTVHCTGKITSDTTELLKTYVKPLLSQSKKVALDLGNVSYIDSSGLGTIVGLYAAAKAASCEFKLVNLNERLKELLAITRLSALKTPAFWSSSAMATSPFAAPGLKLDCEEKTHETIVHCTGRINAENSEAFQKEIHSLIPSSRGHANAVTVRIVLDLTNVTHVDSTGLGALFGAWTAAQKKGCDLEIANLNPLAAKLRTTGFTVGLLAQSLHFLKKIKGLFGSTKV